MNQEQQLSQVDFEELFGPGVSGQPVFSSNNRDILSELGFTYEGGSIAPLDSSNHSTTSTPDFSSYNFDQDSPAYPTPEPNSPHPYPLELQQAYPTIANQQDINHRPRPTRSQTNNAYLYSPQPSQGYGRRRSLSTGDTNRIIAANSITNPTFIRLQIPRVRSTTPDDRRRNGQLPQHGRSASQGLMPRGRPPNPTSTPYHVYHNSLIGGLLPTPIGTPLNETMDIQEMSYGSGHNRVDAVGLTSCSEDPIFRQMIRPNELARSRHVIEIGALAVSNRSKLDPRLESQSPTTSRARILEKLGDIEEHLRDKEGEEALPACMMIRFTLSKRMEAEDVAVADSVGETHMEGPRKKYAESLCDVYDGHDDNQIMEMFMRENGVDGQEAEESGDTE